MAAGGAAVWGPPTTGAAGHCPAWYLAVLPKAGMM